MVKQVEIEQLGCLYHCSCHTHIIRAGRRVLAGVIVKAINAGAMRCTAGRMTSPMRTWAMFTAPW